MKHIGNTEKMYGMGVMGSHCVWGGGVINEENAKWKCHEWDTLYSISMRLQSQP